MEGVSVRELNENKENIPPLALFLATQSSTNPDFVFCSSVKFMLKKKRKLRKPLRDITHLFNNQVLAPITHFQNLPAEQISASAFNLRKRKANDSIQKTVSKSLRMNYR